MKQLFAILILLGSVAWMQVQAQCGGGSKASAAAACCSKTAATSASAAVTPAALPEGIEARVDAQTGQTTYLRKEVSASTGQATYTQVAYHAETGRYEVVTPAQHDAQPGELASNDGHAPGSACCAKGAAGNSNSSCCTGDAKTQSTTSPEVNPQTPQTGQQPQPTTVRQRRSSAVKLVSNPGANEAGRQ